MMRLFAVVFVAVALAAGCAQAGPGTGPSESSGSSGGTVTPAQPGTGTPSAPPPPDLGIVMPTAPGKVTVTISAALAAVGAPLFITVANGLARTIYTGDEKTDCSIVSLQRRTGSSWEDVTGCLFGRPPFTVAIGSGRGRKVKIDPRSGHLFHGQPQGAPAFGAGVYRVTFTYGLTPGSGPATPEEPYTAYSQEFALK